MKINTLAKRTNRVTLSECGSIRDSLRFGVILKQKDILILWVGCYSNNRNLFPVRAVIPKYSISKRRFLLGISFKNLFSIWPFEGSKFVGVQRRMPEVGLHKSKCSSYGLQNIPFTGIIFDLMKV
jgi:hypothetical protein